MPELPDVEVILRYLKSKSLKKSIEMVKVSDSRILKGMTGRKFESSLIGHYFESAVRRGKFCIVKVDYGGCLIFHFGMTGDLKYFKDAAYTPEYTRILFAFDKGYLAYVSQRMLGGVWLTKEPNEVATIVLMGPEPLDPKFTLSIFRERLKERAKMIKALLMDQRFIAGIGNLYADEILFQAGIRPYRKATDLKKGEIRGLYWEIKRVLKDANMVNAEVWRLSHRFLIPHRHSDGICPKCRKELESTSIGNRTSFFCPRCQR